LNVMWEVRSKSHAVLTVFVFSEVKDIFEGW
jgi:hypothetical protein